MALFAEQESSILEFKETIPQNEQILKTVVGFCNVHGGRLILGVKDNREIVGIDETTINTVLEFLHKTIYESCYPPITPDMYTQRVGDKLLLVINVSPGSQKPYFVKTLGVTRGTFVRLGRSTLRADDDTISDLKRQSSHIFFDYTPVYSASVETIQKSRVQNFLQARAVGFKGVITPELLRSYHLVVDEQMKQFPSVGALLLFSENPQHWFPEAYIVCTRFKNASSRTVDATVDCTGPLFEQFEKAYDFITSRLIKSFSINDKRRTDTFEIPPVAIREMLLNAIVHRNYSISGPIKVAIFDNRVEIFSPGIFPGPLDVTKLTSGITYIRNAAIARVFREAGYIEKLGTGFITLFDVYAREGLKSPQIIEGENFIKCILPREKLQSFMKTDVERIIGLLYAQQRISINDVIKHLSISRATAGRRLKELEDNSLILPKGKGRGAYYILKENP